MEVGFLGGLGGVFSRFFVFIRGEVIVFRSFFEAFLGNLFL